MILLIDTGTLVLFPRPRTLLNRLNQVYLQRTVELYLPSKLCTLSPLVLNLPNQTLPYLSHSPTRQIMFISSGSSLQQCMWIRGAGKKYNDMSGL